MADCRPALNAGAHRIARLFSRHHRRGIHHAAAQAGKIGASPAAPGSAPSLACRDTDGPLRAFRKAAAAPGKGGAPATAGKVAAAAATAAGAGLGYQQFASTAPVGPRGGGPLLQQAPLTGTSAVPSFILPPSTDATPGTEVPPQPLTTVPPPGGTPGVTGTVPTPVPEPASVLILAMGVLAIGLTRRRVAQKATQRSPAPTRPGS